jgi:hypothetical protein
LLKDHEVQAIWVLGLIFSVEDSECKTLKSGEMYCWSFGGLGAIGCVFYRNCSDLSGGILLGLVFVVAYGFNLHSVG